jgi:histidinol-phosphate aminotransferase
MSQPAFDVAALIGARVKGLQEYAPEPLQETARRLGFPEEQLCKLDANENPYGATPRAMARVRAFPYVHRYPDPVSRRLRGAIGGYVGVDPANILVGNGSDELIDLILRLFRPGPEGGGVAQVVDCPPTFGMYQFYGVTNDMKVIRLPRGADFGVDVSAVEALCQRDPQPRLLFLASPNNPDGQLLPDEALARLLALPLVVVLDEAYVEFASGSRVAEVDKRDNLIVLRTFSKWAGLAGLRVGYGVFPACLMESLWRLKSPYNVNGMAQEAALATLEDMAVARERIALIVAERVRLLAGLRRLPFLTAYGSQANYILCRLRGIDNPSVRRAMEARGILLRYFDGPGVENCIRISVGTPAQTDAVLRALEALGVSAG